MSIIILFHNNLHRVVHYSPFIPPSSTRPFLRHFTGFNSKLVQNKINRFGSSTRLVRFVCFSRFTFNTPIFMLLLLLLCVCVCVYDSMRLNIFGCCWYWSLAQFHIKTKRTQTRLLHVPSHSRPQIASINRFRLAVNGKIGLCLRANGIWCDDGYSISNVICW